MFSMIVVLMVLALIIGYLIAVNSLLKLVIKSEKQNWFPFLSYWILITIFSYLIANVLLVQTGANIYYVLPTLPIILFVISLVLKIKH